MVLPLNNYNNGVFNLLQSPFFLKTSIFLFLSISSFFLGLHYSHLTTTSLFSSATTTTTTTAIALSPNIHVLFTYPPQPPTQPSPPPPPLPPPPPSPPPSVKKFGIVDENGTMTDDFEIGEYDPNAVEDLGNNTSVIGDVNVNVRVSKFRVSKFRVCDDSLREYIPCLDNVDAINKLNSTEKGERFERHCPETGKGLNCLVPPPVKYKVPIPWPASRDEVQFFS